MTRELGPLRTGLGLIALACIVIVSVRGYWTPDEPREADIAWRMSWQGSHSMPVLAGMSIAEKPPLLYWVSGAAIESLADRPWAARLPNLAYALLTALAMSALARRLYPGNRLIGLQAAALAVSFLLSFQTSVWLATDAPLVAATAISLLGLFRGFAANGTGERLVGYALLHVGVTLGFFAKGPAAWLVPGTVFLILMATERRWRECVRWELWVGAMLPMASIGAWTVAVAAAPGGTEFLRTLLWYNGIGRFWVLAAPPELAYATGHRNWPGKYLIELPVYLVPWTLLVLVALRRAWRELRSPPVPRATVFALAASVAPLVILSCAATARGVYAAPTLLGFAILMAAAAGSPGLPTDAWDRRAADGTRYLIVGLGTVITLAVIALSIAGVAGAWIEPVAALTGTVLAMAAGQRAQRAFRAQSRLHHGLAWLIVAWGAVLLGPVVAAAAIVDSSQRLEATAAALDRDLGDSALALYDPDETTRAWVDHEAQRVFISVAEHPIEPGTHSLRRALEALDDVKLLVMLPGRAASPLSRLADRLGIHPADGKFSAVENLLDTYHLRVERRYEPPGGRRYLLLGRDPALQDPGPSN